MSKIRVIIVDDHAILRAGLALLIDAQPDMDVVDTVPDGPTFVQRVATIRPDVGIVDLTVPVMNAIETIEQTRRQSPRTKVLVLTMHDDPAYVRAALAAGASGYVVKKAADTELLSAIRALHAGRTFIDATLAESMGRGLPDRTAPSGGARVDAERHRLSGREREVLELLAQGYTQQEIANRVGVSVKTVETYRARMAKKLGLRSRADLVRFAVQMGLFSPEKLLGSA